MAFGRKNFGGKKRKRTAPHNIADDFEREKHQKDLEKFLSKLNEDGTPKKLLTQSQLMSIIRGAIREHCWMYAPNKLAFENMSTVPDDSSSRRRWHRQCEDCKGWFKKDEVQTDHRIGEHSLKDFDQIWDFYTSISNVSFEGMASLCIPCHDIKSAMERYGYTKEEALIFKKVTAWEALHKKATPQKKFLMDNGFTEDEVSNPTKRREAIWKYFESLE
ncbi:conserved hypothetical protein [Vibrio phage 501E54-1]|nr:conserved hypothetical protein [Vibrio phage 501E54-1]